MVLINCNKENFRSEHFVELKKNDEICNFIVDFIFFLLCSFPVTILLRESKEAKFTLN